MSTIRRECPDCLGTMREDDADPTHIICGICGLEMIKSDIVDYDLDVWGSSPEI